jgi:hypothetical protein
MAPPSPASPREAEDVFTIDHVDPVERVDVADVPVRDVQPQTDADREPDDAAEPSSAVETGYVTVWRSEGAEPADAEPVDAVEYATAPGMPARGVIVLSLLACALCAAADCALTGSLTMFFDLCFITVCLVGAMAVRREDLFTTGVLAPLALAASVLLVTVAVPDAFVAGGSMSRAFFTGLAAHAAALVSGYGVALAVVGGRVAARRG